MSGKINNMKDRINRDIEKAKEASEKIKKLAKRDKKQFEKNTEIKKLANKDRK